MTTTIIDKKSLLQKVAKIYVLKGLGGKNFDAIPYADDVILRAPICPGGSERPLSGRKNLREQWWAPLPSLLDKVELIDIYVNEDNSAVAAEFYCWIISPACTLRIMDRFVVNDEGKITEQENFFDPRDITNPGTK